MAGYVTVSAEVDGDDVLNELENDEIIKYLETEMSLEALYDNWPNTADKNELKTLLKEHE